MQLSRSECYLFYRLHPALMCYANLKQKILTDQPGEPAEFYALEVEKRVKVRNALHAQPNLIDSFVQENPFQFTSDELKIVAGWKQAVVDSFYIFRYLTNYAVLLSSEKVPKAYGVLALADPFENLIGSHLPRLVQTVLLPFQGKIVYDGLLSEFNVSFGGGIKRMLNDTYRQAKARFGIITSLPFAGDESEPDGPSEAVIVTYDRSGESHETRVGDRKDPTTFPLRLTGAQRKVIAGLIPDLRPRLHLDAANQRNIRLTLDEIRDIARRGEQATRMAQNGMKRNLLERVVFLAEQAIEKYGNSTIHQIPTPQRLFQFRISLRGISPRIWRRIQVKDCTLDRLHEHIQTAMGWTNSHLHSFSIKDQRYGDPMLLQEGFDEMDSEDSTTTRLSQILPESGERFRFDYEYDFGDCWEHSVLFEGCLRAEKGARYPLCLEGQRACPPEDVGGTDGYYEYLEALADPEDEEHDEWLKWRGEFDPEAFDAEAVTKRMRRGLPNWRDCEQI